jgi:hypothetical protein
MSQYKGKCTESTATISHDAEMAELRVLRHFSRNINHIDTILLIGSPDFDHYMDEFSAKHRYIIHDQAPKTALNERTFCLSKLHELPIQPESINLALMAHTLEQTNKVALLLQETIELLTPNGYLVIFGSKRPLFMPNDIAALLRDQHMTILTNRRYSIPHLCIGEPWQSWIELCLPFLCQSYAMIAQKRIHKLTPIRCNPVQFYQRNTNACR